MAERCTRLTLEKACALPASRSTRLAGQALHLSGVGCVTRGESREAPGGWSVLLRVTRARFMPSEAVLSRSGSYCNLFIFNRLKSLVGPRAMLVAVPHSVSDSKYPPQVRAQAVNELWRKRIAAGYEIYSREVARCLEGWQLCRRRGRDGWRRAERRSGLAGARRGRSRGQDQLPASRIR